MISVPSEFDAAQYADSCQYTPLINLILGNYASTAYGSTTTATDSAANYPSAGAIDGDRTEINIGAASAADNGVGQSSWRSVTVPNGSGNVTLQIIFNATRTFTRVKLYNLAADPLTSYVLQYWTGSAWVTFAGSPDKYTPPGLYGYGSGGYGTGPYGGSGTGGSGWPGLGYTGKLDVYDFSAITSTKIQLIVYATQNADAANVVEVEVYRAIDISSRSIGFKIDRQKDFKQANPMAATADVTLDNSDQFFSLSYTPTTAQTTAGYVNSEIAALGFDIEINEGFYTYNGIERIRTFTGNADTVTISAHGAMAHIQCRDYTKHVINLIDSCNLKTSIDITAAILYLLNRANISTYETSLFTTGIVLDYFFDFEASMLTTIQQLVQAAGDAVFYFDENGYATFNFFLNNEPDSYSVLTQPNWQTGTTVNIDSTSNVGSIQRGFFLIDNFSDGDYTSNPAWTATATGSGAASVTSSILFLQATTTGTIAVTLPAATFSQFYGTFAANITTDTSLGSSVTGGTAYWWFNYNYGLQWDFAAGLISIVKNHASPTVINLGISATDSSNHDYSVTITSAGLITVYNSGTPIGNVTDTTYTTGNGVDLQASNLTGVGTPRFKITNLYWSASVTSFSYGAFLTNAQAVWTSPTVNQNADGIISSEGTLTATTTKPAGTSITFYTRTSVDAAVWSPWTAIGGTGQILSPVRQYIQVQAVLAAPQDDGNHNANTVTPYATNFILTWFFGSGQQKWTSDINFYLSYNNTIQDVDQQISDNLGGDSAIINDVAVTSAPLVLGGADADTTWQGVAGTPAAKISVSNPLAVAVGTLVYNISVSGGMDTANMAGGTCIVMTLAGGATGTAAITTISPTKPVLTLTITNAGTITDLRLIGKTYQNAQTPYQATATNATSIIKFHKRHQDINNDYIISKTIAGIIATKTITNFVSPIAWISRLAIIPKINMQAGDQVNVRELITGISANYYVTGYTRTINMSPSGATVSMDLTLFVVT